MRLLITISDHLEGAHFSEFLKSKGIDNECEIVPNSDWGSPDYGNLKCNIWVIDEDQVEAANGWTEAFRKDPKNPLFLTKEPSGLGAALFSKIEDSIDGSSAKVPYMQPTAQKGLGFVTLYILVTCSLLLLYGDLTTPEVNMTLLPKLPPMPIFSPPINKFLMYDYPAAFEWVDRLVNIYGMDHIQSVQDLPPEGQLIYNQAIQTPYWQGFYDLLVAKLKNPLSGWNFNVPLFEKIREGEIWRLFTPCLLHANLLHLFFNMSWLLVLGKMIEERLGIPHYVLFILITAIVSNTAQYLMSGPEFLGFSGVVCAMLGFIWARQRRAAWEGYRLMPGTIPFLFFFVMAMAAIQLVGFLLEVFWNYPSFSIIANTAHIAGGIIGYLLGITNFFAIKKA